MKTNLASILNYVAALVSLVFGVIYLTRLEFMPYHREALGITWEEVGACEKGLILALMRAVGGGFLLTAFLISFLQYRFDISRTAWIPGVILVGGSLSVFSSLYATLTLKLNTPGAPPIMIVLTTGILLIAAYFLNMAVIKKNMPGNKPPLT